MPRVVPRAIRERDAVERRDAAGIGEPQVVDRDDRLAAAHTRASSQRSASSTVTGSSRISGREGVRQRGHPGRSKAKRIELLDPTEDVPWASLECDAALCEHDDAVDVVRQRLDVVLGDEHGHARVPDEPPDDVEHLGRTDRVEVRGRLVHDQDRRFHDEHRGDRETLLLPTRQRERRALLKPGEPDRFERRGDPRRHRLAHDAQVLEPERDLLRDRRLTELVLRVVEDDPDRARHLADGGGRRVAAGRRARVP